MYWGHHTTGVHVAGLDGSNNTPLYAGTAFCDEGIAGAGGKQIGDITVDQTNGYVYKMFRLRDIGQNRSRAKKKNRNPCTGVKNL